MGIHHPQTIEYGQPFVLPRNKFVQPRPIDATRGEFLFHLIRHRVHGQINFINRIVNLSGEGARQILRGRLGPFLVAQPALPQGKTRQPDEK